LSHLKDIHLFYLSHTWQIYLKCKAGGKFNETEGNQQHQEGSIDLYDFFLTKSNGNKQSLKINNHNNSYKKS
jgi:hypothetical protein